MNYGQPGWERSRCSIAFSSRWMEASSSRSVSLACGICIIIPICLRALSMNAKPSAKFMVSKFAEKESTVADGIKISREVDDAASRFRPQIIANRIASANRIDVVLESRRGRGCDISARHLLPASHVQRWYVDPIWTARCRNAFSALFPFELCKGDLSIRLTSSTGGGTTAASTTTFSATKGRF